MDGTHVGSEVATEVNSALETAIQEHFRRPDAARPFTPHTVCGLADVADEASLQQALDQEEESGWDPLESRPAAGVHLFAEPLPDGTALVSVSITNETIVEPAEFHDRSFYDCRIRVTPIEPTRILPQRFRMAPNDYRYHAVAEVIGHGRNCVAVQDGAGIRSETLPHFVQQTVRPPEDHVPNLNWLKTSVRPDPPSACDP